MLEKYIAAPREFGEVAFYWWVGEPLTKERLMWQLERLSDKNICGLQINYCHTDNGGRGCGLSMESEPKLFSDEWWELFGWFMGECKKRGISVSLSDYTIAAPGQGQYMDRVLQKHPEVIGKTLVYENGKVEVREVPYSVDPMNEKLGDYVISEFYGKFDEHFPGERGQGLNFFFSDELVFNVRGNLWNDGFAEKFREYKGYDITPHLKAIFEDIGAITQKIRLDYYDVIVRLCEDGYFKKIYNWNEEGGMTFGCDHGGRGRDVTEFGDYFRTQRWTQGPGNDQPNFASDIIKTKVSSSISHLYGRPRTWLEGFYGSGWGTSSGELADAVFRNFAVGHNLLTLHGLYYTTYGGYWEWAPPCNHFRMPYWKHMDKFLSCSKRLSYLLTRGDHVCDTAILYPVAAAEGGLDGGEAVNFAFETGEYLYRHATDFDFIDFESIGRAEIDSGELCVSGERYKAVIVPSMRTIRFETLEKLAEFSHSGGIVLICGALPEASDRIGRDDDILTGMVADIVSAHGNPSAPSAVYSILKRSFTPDIETDESPYHLHRRVDGKDVYMLYGANKDALYRFRAHGKAVLFDPWTGGERPLPIKDCDGTVSTLRMPLSASEVQLIAFDGSQSAPLSPCASVPAVSRTNTVNLDGEWDFRLIPTLDNKYGDFAQPPTDGCIGAQARFFRFSHGGREKEIMCSYEPYFYKLGALAHADDAAVLALGEIKPGTEIELDGVRHSFSEYEFSMRYGVKNDAGPQHSYHGLKGHVSDDFIALGEKVVTYVNSNSYYKEEQDGKIYYMYTSVYAGDDCTAYVKYGEFAPAAIYINGAEVSGRSVALNRGYNRVLLRYDGAGRGYFILDREHETPEQSYPLAMKWYKNRSVLPFSPDENGADVPCVFSFTAPPAAQKLSFTAYGDVKVYFDGKQAKVTSHGGDIYTAETCEVKKSVCEVRIEVSAHPGAYESAIAAPVDIVCADGTISQGDWGEIDGLRCYSGGASYEKRVEIPKNTSCTVDLGEVGCSAELFVNGVSAGVRMTKPYRFDITSLCAEGVNTIRAEVFNTLYNHYLTIPTGYNQRRQLSGLVGGAHIEFNTKD